MHIKYNPSSENKSKCWLMVPRSLEGWFSFQKNIEHSYAVFKNTSVIDGKRLFLFDVLNGIVKELND